MKTKTKSLYVTFCFALFLRSSLAHEIVVHQQITLNAAYSAEDYSSDYNDFLNAISSDCSAAQAEGLMKTGSGLEDNTGQDAGGFRPLNHFYDPLDNQYGKGLSDIVSGHKQLGQNSFVWASISNSPGVNLFANPNTSNTWSWQNARGYEWLGLTSTNAADRRANLGYMFRALGQVMHLLQDPSQPQHARNENHLDYWPYISVYVSFPTPLHSYIEDYEAKNYATLNYYNDILDWRGLEFTKMENFWDRGLYRTNGVQALNDDASGGAQLGLAEFSNGNFLGERHSYAEYFFSWQLGYYPFPALFTSTDYSQVIKNLPGAVDTFTLYNGHQGNGIYLHKTGDGITFTHHSRLTYLGAMFPGSLMYNVSQTTTKDNNVDYDYLNILIPKAVKYSAGLIDYYFRGDIQVSVATNLGQYTLTVINYSGQFFSGGSFSLFQDDSSGNRTPVQQNDFTGQTLSSGGYVQFTFNATLSQTTKFTLVYQGNIGVDGGGNPLDPVDAGIGIAAQTFTLDPVNGCTDCGCTFTGNSGCPCGCD
jgi:hypothetical protein